ncbi:MAG: MotA/TolQ/ExbB proton channel family protein [bacterium]|nr:MotA/TolQ/ExbB proton channel family protein [candidate division KSB1 bacterium]MDH7559651.1 MotA/TolQ/ExbB proton channel family protein [bacterium]
MSLETIAAFFKHGGPFMYVIALAMVFGYAIAIERIIVLAFRTRIDTPAFVNRIQELVHSGNVARAIEYARRSEAPLPRIVRAGLEQFQNGGGEKDVQRAFELAALVEVPKLEKRTHYLSTIANVATLLGLLGTIFGLIVSFQAVAQAEAAQKAELLSVGISQAMNTTAFGLIVAIPCLLAYGYLQEKTNGIVDEINESVARIFQGLTVRGGK